MAIKTVIDSENKSFKPIVISLTITIDSKESLKQLREEFKWANLDQYHIMSGDDQEDLSLLSDIVKQIEEAL